MKKKILIITLFLVIFQAIYPFTINVIAVRNDDTSKDNNKKDKSIFSEDITYKWEVFKDNEIMPYGLLTPSNFGSKDKIPMIVWLHGTGHDGVSPNFVEAGLPSVICNWDLENFCAYVLCPSVVSINSEKWTQISVRNKVENLINQFIAENNVDSNNIVIVGHSGGGPGALYYASSMVGMFSKAVIFSGFDKGLRKCYNTNIMLCRGL